MPTPGCAVGVEIGKVRTVHAAAHATALPLALHGTLALARAHTVLMGIGKLIAADDAVLVGIHLREAQRIAAHAGALRAYAVEFLLRDHAVAVTVEGGERGARLGRSGQAHAGEQGSSTEGRQDTHGFFHDALLVRERKKRIACTSPLYSCYLKCP